MGGGGSLGGARSDRGGVDGGGGRRGGLGEGGGGVAWSRKENKPSKSEAAFSRRGPDMCLVMQQPPHQPKLGLTEVIKRRGKKGGGKKERRGATAPPHGE